MSEPEIEEIGMQFACLKKAYQEEISFRNAVNGCDDLKADFCSGWAVDGAARVLEPWASSLWVLQSTPENSVLKGPSAMKAT